VARVEPENRERLDALLSSVGMRPGGGLNDLFADARALLAADIRLVLAVLPRGRGNAETTAYRRAAEGMRASSNLGLRASYLELAGRQSGARQLADRVAALGLARPWTAGWARWRPAWPHHVVARHRSGLEGLEIALIDGRWVAAAAGTDGAVVVWDLATGELIGPPGEGHVREAFDVAVGELDGCAVVASVGADCTLRTWEVGTGRAVGTPIQTVEGLAVALGRIDGRTIAVVDGEAVQVFDLAAGELLWEQASEGQEARDCDHTIRPTRLPHLGDAPVVVSGGEDGMASGDPIGAPTPGVTGSVQALTVAGRPGEAVVLVGGDHEFERREVRGDPTTPSGTLRYETGRWVAFGRVGGRLVMADRAEDYSLLVTAAVPGPPFPSPPAPRTGPVALGELNGRGVVLTATRDGDAIQIWDPTTGAPLGDVLRDQISGGQVQAIAVADLHGREVILSGGTDGRVILRAATGRALQRIQVDASVHGLAVRGTQVVVASDRGLLRIDTSAAFVSMGPE
jgi:hypothetical protein